MLNQLATPGKALVTFGTLVRPETGMGSNVELQAFLQRELLAALVAFVYRPGSVEDLVMIPEAAATLETCVANDAKIFLWRILRFSFLVAAILLRSFGILVVAVGR